MYSYDNSQCYKCEMKLFLASLTLTVILSSVETQLRDYREKHIYHPNPGGFKCKSTGLHCKDCRSLVWCQENDEGNLVPVSAGACPITQICEDGRCITAINSDCSPIHDFDFPCTTIGMYPDPADCREYHICAPKNDSEPQHLKASRVPCTNDNSTVYGYNPRSTFCDLKLKMNVCTGYPIPTCATLGEVHPLKENPSLYYTCAIHPKDVDVFYPYQQACPNGRVYYSNYNECL